MQTPYIHTTDRVFITRAVGFDNQNGVTYEETGGEHSLWAARIPFLPLMTSDDFTRMGRNRIEFIQQRQVRFMYDLVRSRENQATFELRFISTPNQVKGQPNLIDIVFLGKIFSTRQGAGVDLSKRLWEKFVSIFPLEDPFNYPLEPIMSRNEFLYYYEPMPLDALRNKNILEIRKYEDMPIKSPAKMGRVERKGDYIAHPFVPSVDFTPMGRFLTALADQPQKCFVGISLRPTRLYDHEVYNTSFAIGQFKKIATEDDDITEEYIRTRSIIGTYVYQKMMMDREQMAMARVQIVGEKETPYALAEALGSEMMGNIDNQYPTQWVMAQPADDTELQTAIHNIKYLEQDIWGHTLASPPLYRLRYLVTPHEAYGAFRLPVAPESGYLPGVLVKSEPFVAFAEDLEIQYQARANMDDATQATKDEASKPKISLGMVYHRGNPTPQPFSIKVEDLVRHTLIAGSTGSGKSTTIKHILIQLWQEHQIPFLVLYPIDKPDYRDLLAFPSIRNNLLIFTLGDASTSPFRFNPFEVPHGLLIKTHISRLMRVFMAAFTLQEPLPMIYREALRKIYQEKGWDIVSGKGDTQSGKLYPVMSEFYATIQTITDGLEYGKEVKDNVRQASVIRIADLLENAGHVVNVRTSMPFATILNNPVIMEIGRVGSVQDTSLLMGFLLMRLAEEIERNPRKLNSPHITVVEEAHRLMAEVGLGGGDSRSSAGEDFANILAEVRGFGEGLIIAEQMPTMLVKGAIGNTFLKIMHWLEDAPSFDLFGNIMNLDPKQREYARTLSTGFAVVRSPSGHPVHIKIPELDDQSGKEKIPESSKSDETTKVFMEKQRKRLDIADKEVIPWNASLAARSNGDSSRSATASASQGAKASNVWDVSPNNLATIMLSPMKTCLYCSPWKMKKQCPYATRIVDLFGQNKKIKGPIEFWLDKAFDEHDRKKSLDQSTLDKIQPLLVEVMKIVKAAKISPVSEAVYCLCAHAVDDWQHKHPLNDISRRTVGQRFLAHVNSVCAKIDSQKA